MVLTQQGHKLDSPTAVPTGKDVDVVFNDSGHLKFLYLGAEPLGQHNKDVHVLLPSHTLDGRAPRVPRSPCFKVRENQKKQKIDASVKRASLQFKKKMQRCSMRCFCGPSIARRSLTRHPQGNTILGHQWEGRWDDARQGKNLPRSVTPPQRGILTHQNSDVLLFFLQEVL